MTRDRLQKRVLTAQINNVQFNAIRYQKYAILGDQKPSGPMKVIQAEPGTHQILRITPLTRK
jgi:hypothetical protein